MNEAFVREVMNGENPRGKLIADSRGGVREVIGIVQDSKYPNLKSATPPVMYQPFLQTNTGRGQMTLHVLIAPDSPWRRRAHTPGSTAHRCQHAAARARDAGSPGRRRAEP